MEANWILKANQKYGLWHRFPYALAVLAVLGFGIYLGIFLKSFALFQSFLVPASSFKSYSASEAVLHGGPVYSLLGFLPLQWGMLLGMILFFRYWLYQDYNAAITRTFILFWLGQWGLCLALAMPGALFFNLSLLLLYFGLLSLYVQNFQRYQQLLLYFLAALLGLQLGPVIFLCILLATGFFLRSIAFKSDGVSWIGLLVFVLSVPFHVFYIVQTSLQDWLGYGYPWLWHWPGAHYPLLLVLGFLSCGSLAFYLFPALADLWDARDEYSSKLLIAVLLLALGILVLVPQQILLVLLLLIFFVSLQLAKIWDEYYSNAYRLENYLALSYFTGAVVGILFLILCGWAAKAGWFYFKGDFFNWLMGLILVLLLSSLLPMLALYYLRNHPLALRAQLCWQWVFLVLLILAFPYFAPQNLVDQFGFKIAPSNIEPVLAINQFQSGVFMLQRRQWDAIDLRTRKAYQVQFESPQLVLVKK